jgi:1-acyl-sn-glycerol-3-phosphate acyltransferase
MLISNHISFLDVLVLMALHTPAFLAKGSTQRIPIIGCLADKWQCIYTTYDDKILLKTSSSSKPVHLHGGSAIRIRNRQKKMQQNPNLFPPLCIFPEGSIIEAQFSVYILYILDQ